MARATGVWRSFRGWWDRFMSDVSAFFFTTVTGFVMAGFIGSFHRLVTNRPPSFQIMATSVVMQCLGVLTLIFAGPNVILRNALRAQVFENRPPLWLFFSALLATMWSFLSGVLFLGILISI